MEKKVGSLQGSTTTSNSYTKNNQYFLQGAKFSTIALTEILYKVTQFKKSQNQTLNKKE